MCGLDSVTMIFGPGVMHGYTKIRSGLGHYAMVDIPRVWWGVWEDNTSQEDGHFAFTILISKLDSVLILHHYAVKVAFCEKIHNRARNKYYNQREMIIFKPVI